MIVAKDYIPEDDYLELLRRNVWFRMIADNPDGAISIEDIPREKGRPDHYVDPRNGAIAVCRAGQTMDELVEEGKNPPAPRRLVPKSTIISRLNDAGLLEKASEALSKNVLARERWYSPDRPSVGADDKDTIDFLKSIGASAKQIKVILAP